MPRPVHFEFSSADPEKAQAFYSKVFGWSFKKWDGPMSYWLITTGQEGEPGIDGGMLQRSEQTPPGTVNTMDVASVDAAVETITAAGGTIAMPKMAIPGMGWVAYAVDLDGNTFGVFEMDDKAK